MPNDWQRARFPARHSFHTDLARRVEQYFEGTGRSRHGGWMIGAKAAALIAWLAASYAVLMFVPLHAWQAALLSVSVGFAMAGVGLSVLPAANHGARSVTA